MEGISGEGTATGIFFDNESHMKILQNRTKQEEVLLFKYGAYICLFHTHKFIDKFFGRCYQVMSLFLSFYLDCLYAVEKGGKKKRV